MATHICKCECYGLRNRKWKEDETVDLTEEEAKSAFVERFFEPVGNGKTAVKGKKAEDPKTLKGVQEQQKPPVPVGMDDNKKGAKK